MAHLAEFNIAKLTHDLDAPENAEFVAALDPINAIAEASPGFVWRLTDDDGASASYVVNYSIWENLESLRHYVNKSGHSSYLRRRRDWFEPLSEAATVCWWIKEGERPSVSEAMARLTALRTNGPSQDAWPLNKPFDPPSD